MTQRRIRTALMDATVRVVARDGLDKLTTRSIANECELHDTYIYRYFIDKDDLLARTFAREGETINDLMLKNSKYLETNDSDMTFREKITALWSPAWQYLVENPDACKFYVRYYYSAHFEAGSMRAYSSKGAEVKEYFKSILPADIDVDILYNHNADTLLHLAMRIAMGEVEYTDELSDEIFDLMYSINYAFVKQRDEGS